MRKVTEQTTQAFLNGMPLKIGNTHTDRMSLYLHGNEIARKENGVIKITNAGWATNTTKERLNGLPGVSISQMKGLWYLNGKRWGGEWTEVYKIY